MGAAGPFHQTSINDRNPSDALYTGACRKKLLCFKVVKNATEQLNRNGESIESQRTPLASKTVDVDALG